MMDKLEYIKLKGYRFFGPDGERAPHKIKWDNFPNNIQIRQEPGNLNSVGRLKFVFPNNHHVYLHDTPAKKLFNSNKREYSSGCIRLQNPENLASYLLDKSIEEVRSMIDNPKYYDTWLNVNSPLPIYVVDGPGWEVWIDEDKMVRYK